MFLAFAEMSPALPESVPPQLDRLDAIDLALSGLAVVLLSLMALRKVLRPVRDRPVLPHRPRSIDEIVVALGFSAYVLAGAGFNYLSTRFESDTDPRLAQLAAGTATQALAAIVCLLLVSFRAKVTQRTFWLGARHAPRAPVRITALATLFALGLCPLVLMLTLEALIRLVPGYEPTMHPTLTALSRGTLPTGAVMLLWVGAAVVAPIAEEVFFRGILQTAALNVTRSRRFAVITASAVFAAVHFDQVHALPALFFLGLILGTAYETTGALIVPVTIHVAFNLRTLIWQALGAGS